MNHSMKATGQADSPATRDCLLAQADAFTAGARQHDDMTLLVATIA